MQRCFDFKSFKQLCPIDQKQVINSLMLRHFGEQSDKRKTRMEQNLRTIIESTFALSNKIGFAKMSMRDLQKHCGMSLGGLYNYFESKEALALMITDALHHIAFDWLPGLIHKDMEPPEKLEHLVRGHIYLSQILRPWFYFVFMEIKTLPDANKRKAQEVELNFQKMLEDIFQQSLPASHIMALMQDWHVKHWKYRKHDIDQFADSVNAIAQGCLKSDLAHHSIEASGS